MSGPPRGRGSRRPGQPSIPGGKSPRPWPDEPHLGTSIPGPRPLPEPSLPTFPEALIRTARDILRKITGADLSDHYSTYADVSRELLAQDIRRQLKAGESVKLVYNSSGDLIAITASDEPKLDPTSTTRTIESEVPACAPPSTPKEVTVPTPDGRRVRVPVTQRGAKPAPVPSEPESDPPILNERGPIDDQKLERGIDWAGGDFGHATGGEGTAYA